MVVGPRPLDLRWSRPSAVDRLVPSQKDSWRPPDRDVLRAAEELDAGVGSATADAVKAWWQEHQAAVYGALLRVEKTKLEGVAQTSRTERVLRLRPPKFRLLTEVSPDSIRFPETPEAFQEELLRHAQELRPRGALPGPLAPPSPCAPRRPHGRPGLHLSHVRRAAPAAGTAGRGGRADLPRNGADRQEGVPGHIPRRAAATPGVRPTGLRPAGPNGHLGGPGVGDPRPPALSSPPPLPRQEAPGVAGAQQPARRARILPPAAGEGRRAGPPGNPPGAKARRAPGALRPPAAAVGPDRGPSLPLAVGWLGDPARGGLVGRPG